MTCLFANHRGCLTLSADWRVNFFFLGGLEIFYLIFYLILQCPLGGSMMHVKKLTKDWTTPTLLFARIAQCSPRIAQWNLSAILFPPPIAVHDPSSLVKPDGHRTPSRVSVGYTSSPRVISLPSGAF
jgi:hypothetical protein